MWSKVLSGFKSYCISKGLLADPSAPKHKPIRRKVDTASIRTRVASIGWSLKEIPIINQNPITGERQIARWKLIAYKGVQSVEVGGENIDEAMKNIGKMLGVISAKESENAA